MTANFIIKCFLALVPFIYLLQVTLYRNDFVPIPYLVVFAVILLTVWRVRVRQVHRERQSVLLFDELVGFFVAMNCGWFFFELVVSGIASAARVFIYFVIPPILYFHISRRMSHRDLEHILWILIATSTAVALQVLYERYHNQILLEPTAFQLRNFEYVAAIGSGEELYQLKEIGYRAPGILEHLHATALFVGLGAVCSLYLCLSRLSLYKVLFLAVTLSALLVSGGRTALIATLGGMGLLMGLTWRFALNGIRTRRNLVIGTGLVAAIVVFFVFFYQPLRSVYLPLLTGELIPDRSFIWDVVPEELTIWYEGMRRVPLAILFGLGPGGESWRSELGLSSDDFFPIDVVGRYGLVGATVFYLMRIVSWHETLRKLRGERHVAIRRTCLVWACVITVLMLTTVHSGAIMRKGFFPWLFVAYAGSRRLWQGTYAPILSRNREVCHHDGSGTTED